MENCSTPTVDQKNYEETTTLFGIDGEDSASKRRRKRRSLGRRVSFAEAPAYHIYARDDDYISPSHDKQDAKGLAAEIVQERRSPRIASKRQAASNLSEDRLSRRRSKKQFGAANVTPGSPSVNPARNTSSLLGDGGEFIGFVDTGNTSFGQEKEHIIDEDVTLDSTTFLSQLYNVNVQPVADEDMLVERPSSTEENKKLPAGRESPPSGTGEHDMSMSFTMVNPIIRRILDFHPGPIDENTDMSITMQVRRKRQNFLDIDNKQTEADFDQSITADIPSLQTLVQEEEEEDMVTDMKMDTEVLISGTRVISESVGNLATEVSRSLQDSNVEPFGGDRKALVEKEFHNLTRTEDKGSHFYRDGFDEDRSITLAIPRLEDIIKEEEKNDTDTVEDKTATENVSLPSSHCGIKNTPTSDGDFSLSITAQVPRCSDLLAADSVSPDEASEWNKSRRSSWVAPPPSSLASAQLGESEDGGNVCATPLSDSGMDIVDDSGDPTMYLQEIAFNRAQQNIEQMNSSSPEGDLPVESAAVRVVDIARAAGGNVCVTPLSDSDMEIIDDRGEPTSYPEAIVSTVAKQNDQLINSSSETVCAVEDADIQIVDLTGLKSPQSLQNVTPASSSGGNMHIVRSAADSTLQSRSVPFAGSRDQDEIKTPTDRSREMDIVEEPSPTSRTGDAKELITSVLKSAARLATNPHPNLHNRFEKKHDRNGSRTSPFAPKAESRSPQQSEPTPPGSKLQRSLFMERFMCRANTVGTPLQELRSTTEHSKDFTVMLSSNSLTKNKTSVSKRYHHSSMCTTGQTTEIQEDSFGMLRERVTHQLNSGRKIQVPSGDLTQCNTEVTRDNEARQDFSLPDGSIVEHMRKKDGGNIPVAEFLMLAEVKFCPKPGKSSPPTTDDSLAQAHEVSNFCDALKLSFVIQPQVMHLVEACNAVKDELQRLNLSEAGLEAALSASNPPLFSRFQEANAAEKQRLKEKIHQLRTKCGLAVNEIWLNFRLGLEEDKSLKLLEAKKEIESREQELRDLKRFLEENHEQILNLQARIQSKENKSGGYPSESAAANAHEEKAQKNFFLDKIKYLKEQLADVTLSGKVKLEKLLKRMQISEKACKASKECLESSNGRLHDLQTKLAENVRMSYGQTGVLQAAGGPGFYAKEIMNKISLLKTILGGLEARTVGQDMVELSYSPIIRRRLVVVKSVGATSVTKSTWDLDPEKIELMFPGINAVEAFQQTLTDGADFTSRNPQSLRSCIQSTRFLVSNFLMLMEEAGRCQNVPSAVAGGGVMVIPRFLTENDKNLKLEIKFLDCLVSAKIILTLDLRSAQLNGYPFGTVPTKVDIKYCPRRFSHKLTSAALEDAVATVEPGYHRMERLCANVCSLLASVQKEPRSDSIAELALM